MKRIYRNKKEGKLGGVCSGIGDYLDIDPVIIRLIFILSVFAWGSGILIYIILWLIIPTNPNPNKVTPVKKDRNNTLLIIGFIVFSIFLVGHFIESTFWMVNTQSDYRSNIGGKQYDSMHRDKCLSVSKKINSTDEDSNKSKDIFDKCMKRGSGPMKHNNFNDRHMMRRDHNPVFPFIAGAIFVIIITKFLQKK